MIFSRNSSFTLAALIPNSQPGSISRGSATSSGLPVACGKSVRSGDRAISTPRTAAASLCHSLPGTFPASILAMIFFLAAHAFSLLLDLIGLSRQTGHAKDVEILLLRQQLRILQRKQPSPLRISEWEKL